MKDLKVQVAENHIRRGDRSDASSCPIALAISAHLPDMHVAVFHHETRIIADRLTIEVLKHSDDVTEWIDNFDTNEEVAPITIELMDGEIDII